MKKALCVIITLVVTLTFFGCAQDNGQRKQSSYNGKTVDDILSGATSTADSAAENTADTTETANTSDIKCDVDLTLLNRTLVYAEVYNMMVAPEEYIGKTVRMKGNFAYSEGDDRYYFACIIRDATACCAQGIEFVLKDERKFPEEYPNFNDIITVVGVFDTYCEGSYKYCQLINAILE